MPAGMITVINALLTVSPGEMVLVMGTKNKGVVHLPVESERLYVTEYIHNSRFLWITSHYGYGSKKPAELTSAG